MYMPEHNVMPAPAVPERSAFLRRRRDGQLAWQREDSPFNKPNVLEVEDEFDRDAADSTRPRCRKKARRSNDNGDGSGGIGDGDLSDLADAIAEDIPFDVDRSLDVFHSFSRGTDTIQDEALARFGASLGWPDRGKADFFLLLYAFHERCEPEYRSVTSVNRDTWLRTFADLGTSSVQVAAQMMHEWAKETFYERKFSLEFAQYYRLVFTYLVVCDRPFPHRCFARNVKIHTAKQALVAVLGQFTPYASSFCAYLDTTNVAMLNMDQWTNLLTFARVTPYPSLANYSVRDPWPLVIDDYVVWGRKNGIFEPGAGSAGDEDQSPAESTTTIPHRLGAPFSVSGYTAGNPPQTTGVGTGLTLSLPQYGPGDNARTTAWVWNCGNVPPTGGRFPPVTYGEGIQSQEPPAATAYQPFGSVPPSPSCAPVIGTADYPLISGVPVLNPAAPIPQQQFFEEVAVNSQEE